MPRSFTNGLMTMARFLFPTKFNRTTLVGNEKEKIPAKITANLASAQSQFDKNKRQISDFNQQKITVSEQLAKNKTRLKTLKSAPAEKLAFTMRPSPSLLLGEVPCSENSCINYGKKQVSSSLKKALQLFLLLIIWC
jgi:hypothetical protein